MGRTATRVCRRLAAEYPCCIVGWSALPVVLGVMALTFATRSTRSLTIEQATQWGAEGGPPNPAGDGVLADAVVLGASAGALTHFVHVGDTHISRDFPAWEARFESLMSEGLPAIDPAFVVHTGDMVESKFPSPTPAFHGQVLESEFAAHAALLKTYGWWDSSRWVEMMGNHDGLSVYRKASSKNLFNTYSITGSTKRPDDAVVVFDGPTQRAAGAAGDASAPVTSVRLVTLDQTPEPGLSTPFNTLGRMLDADVARVEALLAAAPPRVQPASGARPANFSVLLVAGHYPLSFMMGHALDDALDAHADVVSAYLCGHLHSAGMWARLGRRGHVMELEVDDMFGSAGYRVMAFDHGLMSFADTRIETWPLVLVTNPKDARWLDPAEPTPLMVTSTHIRLLAFSPADIPPTGIVVAIADVIVCGGDGRDNVPPITASDEHAGLFTCPWSPADYAAGLHDMRVTVEDAEGRETVHTMSFSLDGSGAAIPLNFSNLRSALSSFGAYAAIISLSWALLGGVGIGVGYCLFGVYGAKKHPERLSAWHGWVNRMRAVEAAGHSDKALVAAFGRRATTCGGRAKLYATWGLHRHLWRASLLPRRVAVALGTIVTWIAFAPMFLGPFVADPPESHWAIGFTWGVFVFDSGELVSVPEMCFGATFILLLWTLPLFTICFLPADTAAVPRLGMRASDRDDDDGSGDGSDGSPPSDISGSPTLDIELVHVHSRRPGLDGSDEDEANAHARDIRAGSFESGALGRGRHSVRRCCREHEQVIRPLAFPTFFFLVAGGLYLLWVLWDAFGFATVMLSPVGLVHLVMTVWLVVDAFKRDREGVANRVSAVRAA